VLRNKQARVTSKRPLGAKPHEVGVPADTTAQLNGAIGSIGAHVRDKPPWSRSHYAAIVTRPSDVTAAVP